MVVANAVNATLIAMRTAALIAMATATPNAVVHVMPTAGVIVMPNRVLTAAGSVKNVNVRRCHLSLTC